MFRVNSQNISTLEQRVKTVINAKGDTIVEMNLADARLVLTDLFNARIADSTINVLTERDSINSNIITFQKEELVMLNEKFNNQLSIEENLNKILKNKDSEITLLNDVIKKQKKEIRKQKFLKVLGFTAAIVLPITTIILMAK